MELSAIGEQVFAVESIRKKRVREGVRPPGAAPRTPVGSPFCPQYRLLTSGGGRREQGGARDPGSPAASGPAFQPVPSVSPATL